MTTQISSDNIQPSTLASIGGGPKITNIEITNSSYVVIDDTAVALAGGYIKITGSGFASGCTVIINGTAATSVSFVSSNVLNVQVGAQSAGTYIVYVTNTDGSTAIRVNGITYSGNPTWVTSSTLPSAATDSAFSIQLSATGDTPLTYSLQAGSTLPTGVTLTSGGLLSGTVAGLSVETIYNFTIEAIDPQYQESPRAFSITITVGDMYWKYVTTILSASTPTPLPFNDDASSNNFPLTIVGDTKPNNFNPYTPGYYSAFFDGTGDYLSMTLSAVSWTNGTFTFEAWVYPTSLAADLAVFSTNNGNSRGLFFGIKTDGSTTTDNQADGASIGTSTGTSKVLINSWNHIALTRSGSTITYFVNGILSGTSATGTYYDQTSSSAIIGITAIGAIKPFFGYISNARFVTGSTLYTSSFTPSTSPLTAISGTTLLTCQSNRFIDNSTNNLTITKNGDTKVSSFIPYTPNSSYSTYGSTYLDGTGDYLYTPNSPAAFNFTTTKDVTFECWVYSSSWATYNCFFDIQESQPFRFVYLGASTSLQWHGAGGSSILSATVTLPINTWIHLAFTRSTDTLYMFVNGTQIATGSYSSNWGSTVSGSVYVGCNRGDTWFINGYMTDARLVKGTAVYTSAFTPPTAPLTAISGTSLLTCQGDQPVNNNVFIDNGTNNFLLTRNGNATQGTFGPYGENWSYYYDGSGDYLSLPSAQSSLYLTGAFTWETWIYPIASYGYVYGNWNNGTGDQWSFVYNLSGFSSAGLKIYWYRGNYGQNECAKGSTTGLNANQWNHVAIVRDASNNIYMFLDGQLLTLTTYASGTTWSDSISYTNSSPIGIGGTSTASYNSFNGYLSNMRFVNGTALYTSSFTPSTSPLQPIVKTQLLTCQNPGMKDNSANNYTITNNGNTSVQKFGPFAGTTLPTPYYGAYFDGTGDYLTAPSNSWTSLAGQFTVEFWVNFNAIPTASPFIGVMTAGGFNIYNDGTRLSPNVFGTGNIFNSSVLLSSLTVGTWYHIAVTRDSSNLMTMWLNGVSQGSTTTSSSYSANTWQIGNTNFNCYISNFRATNTCQYTTTFTPSTSPLTAISGTSLLTCQSNTFVDNSTNNFTITAVGNSKPTTFNPFTVTYSTKQSYTPSVFGGSMYFDGTGDYVNVVSASNSAFNLAGDFTIEFWFYDNGSSLLYPTIVGNVTGWSAGSFSFRYNNTGQANKLSIHWNGATPADPFLTSSVTPSGAWHHAALTRSGSTCTLWLDGVSQSTGTYSTALNVSLGGMNIGWSSWDTTNGYFKGYVADVRVTNGTALYTSNFVPNNATLTAVKNTVLLVNGTSAGIYDSSEMNNFETVGDTKLSTTTVKFSGTTSMYFDGTGDYLSAPASSQFAFNTGDYTIEAWIFKADLGVQRGIVDLRGGSNVNVLFYTNTSNQLLAFNSTTSWITSSGTIPLNTWTHVAITRSGTSAKLFINGVVDGTATNSDNNVSVGPAYVGRQFGSTSADWLGYISDLRITKGYARYTSNFSVPTSPFPLK